MPGFFDRADQLEEVAVDIADERRTALGAPDPMPDCAFGILGAGIKRRSGGAPRGTAMGSAGRGCSSPAAFPSQGSCSRSFAAAVGFIMLDQTCSSGATGRSGMA